MIPRRIFYCWFGPNEFTDLNKKCMDSWKQFCPDYEIVEINEQNFSPDTTPYAQYGYEQKNWSAVSNAARLHFLLKYGGFYLDTDVQLVKSLDSLRKYDAGFITEFDSGQPDSGVLGCKKFPWLYQVAAAELVPGSVLHKNFIRNMYKKYDVHGEPITTYSDGFTILGEEYFPTIRTGLYTENTIGIHYFENTWVKTPLKVIDPFYPYQRVNVYVGNKLVHEDSGATIKLTLKDMRKQWSGPQVLHRLNYFFNPRVVKLFSQAFEAERMGYNMTGDEKTCITPTSMIVTYNENLNANSL